ncbi:Uncharacterised protein [Escherichia coli]|nr:Uncharacterised protein [Escherichia coli]CAD5635424.1 Uncharacterised protein [Escherichia coli]
MCHGLFIELIADIKKTNRKGWFFLGIFHESSLIEYVTT